MEFPVWWIPGLSAALPVAVIAIVHVFIAHFAIGGGLFLVLAERAGLRAGEQRETILAYVKGHTRFFMLLTLVAGGLTGVGIWFVIGVASPAGTRELILTFLFGWATEWVFFMGEIVALLVYYYTFGRMRDREHQWVGWVYFVFGWLSLFMINGIIGFMLTPGQWLETGNFWHGFFNPSFWPSLVFRTAICIMLAGLFGYLTAVRIADHAARERMIRFSTWWAAAPFLPLVLSAWWYLQAMPEPQFEMILHKSQEIPPFMSLFAVSTPLIFLGALALAFVTPQQNRRPLAWLLLFLAFMQLGAFEWIREAGRRPYLIWDLTYSNGIPVRDANALNKDGIMSRAKWVRHRPITDDNRLQAGEELYRLQCVGCHSIGGPMLDILPRTAKYGLFGMEAQLTGQGLRSPSMPPFLGNTEEKRALAAFIVEGLHGRTQTASTWEPQQLESPIPDWSEDEEHLLLAWSQSGMRLFSDADRFFSILPPGSTLQAQLLSRDPMPELITEGVVLHYSLQEGFDRPSQQLRLWEFMDSLFYVKRQPDEGLSGNYTTGTMQPDAERRLWQAADLPVSPYGKDGKVLPYPLVTIEARDATDGRLLATTTAVLPVSTEMGCKNCHGGNWRMPSTGTIPPIMGLDDVTGRDILAMHDKRSGTRLLKAGLQGNPVACQKCHTDPAMPLYPGDPQRLGLSAALHGFHAPYLEGLGAEACHACHSGSPTGATRMLRGVHDLAGLSCTDCHGELNDHALALLKVEAEAGKPGAAKLMQGLTPRNATDLEEVRPRLAWLQQPDCLACHQLDGAGGEVTGLNAVHNWTEPGKLFSQSRDALDAMACVACHNSPHALYPAVNPYGAERDNLQPLRVSGSDRPLGSEENCLPCHTMDMGVFPHHPE